MSFAANLGGSAVDLRVLERIRGFEADIERSMDSIVQQELFRDEITNEHHRILVDHFEVQQVRVIHSAATKLLDAYLDEDDIVEAQEAADGRDNGEAGDDVLATALRTFEARIADIREYHHAYRDLPAIRNTLEQPDAETLDRLFTPREHLGSCLDLEPHYERYSTFIITTATLLDNNDNSNNNNNNNNDDDGNTAGNSPKDELVYRELRRHAAVWESRLEYVQFIAQLPNLLLHSIHAYSKVFGFTLYRTFVLELLRYLKHFYIRVHPLTHELHQLVDRTNAESQEYWQALLQEKDHIVSSASVASQTSSGVLTTITSHQSAAARVNVGKSSVMAGLHIPPSLRRYSKSFALWPMSFVEHVLRLHECSSDATQLSSTGAAAAAAESSASSAMRVMSMMPQSWAEVREVCDAEAQIIALTHSLLFHTIEHTEHTVLREYSRTSDELALERGRRRQEFLTSLDQLRQRLTSSVESTVAQAAQYHVQASILAAKEAEEARERVALGVSRAAVGTEEDALQREQEGSSAPLLDEEGNPIPLWLVKLQQLDKKFVCEVCGGTVYRGPKAYYSHFGAERHAEGLRRLGVTHRLHEYEGIAHIRSVIELRDRLQSQKQGSSAALVDGQDAEYDGTVVVSDLRRRLREDQDNEEMQDGQGKVITVKDYRRIQRRRT